MPSTRWPRALILVEDLPVPFDRRVWNEARTLRDAGWRVTVICPKGDEARRSHETIDGIEIFRYPLPTTGSGLLRHIAEYAVALPATLLLALRVRLRGRIDVVHACNPPDFFFPIGRLLRALGSAFVFDQHDLAPEVYVAQGGRRGGAVHRFLLWSERRTYALADVVISTNESYRRFAIERGGVDPERVHVVRSAPETGRIFEVAPDPTLRAGRPYLIAYLGTMGPQDGVDLVVEAAAELERLDPGSVRIIAMGGGGELERLRGMVVARGLEAVITFPGRVSDEVLRQVLATADVALSPDPANGFNEYCTMNKTLEYMAAGVPVVAFDLTETRVSAGDAAIYATPNDAAELAGLAAELLRSPERRAEMGRIGRDRIQGDLAWRVSAANLTAAYRAAVSARRGPPGGPAKGG